MTHFSSAVADLQEKWHTLPDRDRARAVFNIHQAGMSLRALARDLNCSLSLLRHLLVALQAPALDRALARDNKISTRELARRARTTGIRRATRHREALELDRERVALVGRQAIFDWLAAENISSPYGEQIVEEARWSLTMAEQTGKLPRGAAPPDMPITDIIQRCKPTAPCTDQAEEYLLQASVLLTVARPFLVTRLAQYQLITRKVSLLRHLA